MNYNILQRIKQFITRLRKRKQGYLQEKDYLDATNSYKRAQTKIVSFILDRKRKANKGTRKKYKKWLKILRNKMQIL